MMDFAKKYLMLSKVSCHVYQVLKWAHLTEMELLAGKILTEESLSVDNS